MRKFVFLLLLVSAVLGWASCVSNLYAIFLDVDGVCLDGSVVENSCSNYTHDCPVMQPVGNGSYYVNQNAVSSCVYSSYNSGVCPDRNQFKVIQVRCSFDLICDDCSAQEIQCTQNGGVWAPSSVTGVCGECKKSIKTKRQKAHNSTIHSIHYRCCRAFNISRKRKCHIKTANYLNNRSNKSNDRKNELDYSYYCCKSGRNSQKCGNRHKLTIR